MVGGALVPASFVDFHEEMRHWSSTNNQEIQMFAQIVLWLVIIAALAAFTYLLRPLGEQQDRNPLARLQELLRRQWVPFGLVLIMAALTVLGFAKEAGWLAAIIANVAMIAFTIWLMRVGLREEDGKLFAMGVAYFLLWSVLRYIDLFGDAGGMLGAALMFFLCGAGLFGLAWFWGKRKEFVHAK